ncbi:MAG: imidazolonepropionase [Chloroflexi bacterium]|nr:imidazolonepropionase [Chloroflexota bacterium]
MGRRSDVSRALANAGLRGSEITELDARGGLVTPGLIDPHTHLLFGGTRESEVAMRRSGAGYLQILAAGGGILSTVERTRAATDAWLIAEGRRWLQQMLHHGVTTVEAKSGYGLDTPSELRLLDVARRLDDEGPVEIVPTYLGAHAVPPEFRGRADGTAAYVRAVIEEQLPEVARQGVARFCDVFCEEGVFSAEQSRAVLSAARRHGLGLRLHADELRPSGGAELAAELRVASADHLGAISSQGIAALAEAAGSAAPVVATMLPMTSLYLDLATAPPARALIDRGVPVALGTDFNPGTSPSPNLPLAMSMAWLKLGLSASEALVAATINAAYSLGLGATHGSLEPGKQADLVIWDVPSLEQLPYWLGADLARVVVKRGRVVASRG